jgi:hypothetical protein
VRELTDLEFDILKILADNKGHALLELAKLLGKEKSNLIITLNRLEEEIELSDSHKISYIDIIDANYLWLKFLKPNDLLTQFIRKQFRPEIIPIMDKDYYNFNLYASLELNRILDDPNLFEEKRFAHIMLSEKIGDLISKRPEGLDLRYLNRLLLEEAYPDGIMKCQASLIYKGLERKTTNPNSRQPKHHEIPYFITLNYFVLRFLIITLDLAYDRYSPQISKRDQDKLKQLRKQVEWRQISEGDYREIELEIYCESHDAESLHRAQEKHALLDKFLSSQYVLQFVEEHGFKKTIYQIHDMVRSWDRCWALGESAINSGVIKDETDLECAQRLIRFHRSVEEGIRELEQNGRNDEEEDDIP